MWESKLLGADFTSTWEEALGRKRNHLALRGLKIKEHRIGKSKKENFSEARKNLQYQYIVARPAVRDLRRADEILTSS